MYLCFFLNNCVCLCVVYVCVCVLYGCVWYCVVVCVCFVCVFL